MTPIVALLVGIAVGAGLVLTSQFMGTLNNRISTLKDIQEGIEAILGQPGMADDEPEEVDDLETTEAPAIPLDPANPPVPRTFNPSRSRDPHDYPVCNCHDRRLTAGEEILWWPQPDGSVMIFHPDFISQTAKQ